MNRYNRDAHFVSSLETLLKLKDKKELAVKSKKLENYVIENNNPMLAFRLALELDDRDIQTTKLQNFIINSGDARYILKFAREIKRANIKRLQSAIMKYGNILQIAKFGCFVGTAQRKPIENLIAKSDSAKSAYLFLKFIKFCNINKLKPIIFRSKKPRYLYLVAKKTSNKKDLNLIQELIINSGSFMYMRLFAVNIKGADVDKIVNKIISSNNILEMKRLYRVVKSPRLEKLSVLF
jgi:hypothetical protein